MPPPRRRRRSHSRQVIQRGPYCHHHQPHRRHERATDSVYAIQLSLNGAAPQYLQGDGTLGGGIILKTAAQWATGNANVYKDAGQGTMISATVQVQQKSDSTFLTSAPTVKKTPGGTVDAGFSALVSTVTLDNYIYGAPIAGPFPVVFGTSILPASVAGKVVLTRVSDGQTIPLDLTNYSDATETLLRETGRGLGSVYGIQGSRSTGRRHPRLPEHRHHRRRPKATVFVTALNPAETTTVTSLYDTAKQVDLSVPSGVFPAGGYVVPRTSFISPNHTLTNGSLRGQPADPRVGAHHGNC